MATKTKPDNLKQPESVTEKLKHIVSDYNNGNQMTTLDVEKLCITTDEIAQAMLWLEEVALENKQGAAHALAICFFIEGQARSLARQSSSK